MIFEWLHPYFWALSKSTVCLCVFRVLCPSEELMRISDVSIGFPTNLMTWYSPSSPLAPVTAWHILWHFTVLTLTLPDCYCQSVTLAYFFTTFAAASGLASCPWSHRVVFDVKNIVYGGVYLLTSMFSWSVNRLLREILTFNIDPVFCCYSVTKTECVKITLKVLDD